MSASGQKLLERMRQSTSNWKRRDLDALLLAFGFLIVHGGSHDIVKHPEFPFLRGTLPRHRSLAKGYVEHAVKLVDRLLELQKEAKSANPTQSEG